jgi:hypothetical protein
VTPVPTGTGVTVMYGHQDTKCDNLVDTWTLSKYSNGTVFDNQMWGANFGVLP